MLRYFTLSCFFFFLLSFFAFAQDKSSQESIRVSISTGLGTMVFELYPEKAPETVKNFLSYADDDFYKGTIFHRVIKGFMVQGGGFDKDMQQKSTRASIKNEADNGLKNIKGSIAMARTVFPHSATSQFFINTKDNSFLDFKKADQQGYGYCVFGNLIEGMDVLEKIEGLPTVFKKGHQDVPREAVFILDIKREPTEG